MTEVEKIAAGLTKAQPKGTVRAFLAMNADWQQPGAKTFSWAGAEQALNRLPTLVEHSCHRTGKQKYPRNNYRLTLLGIAVKAHIERTKQP